MWIDCQGMSPHFARLGAEEVPHATFLRELWRALEDGRTLFPSADENREEEKLEEQAAVQGAQAAHRSWAGRITAMQRAEEFCGIAEFCCNVFHREVNDAETRAAIISRIHAECLEQLTSGNTLFVCAVEGNSDEILGYGEVRFSRSRAFIQTLGTAASHRRRGLGTALP